MKSAGKVVLRKARLAVAGCAETVAFCREHDLPHRVCGKLVVATEPEELPRMKELARRGNANGVENHELDQAGHYFGFAHLAGVDDDRVVSRPKRRHCTRGIQVVAALHIGQHSVVVVAQAVGDVLVVAAARPSLQGVWQIRATASEGGAPARPVGSV